MTFAQRIAAEVARRGIAGGGCDPMPIPEPPDGATDQQITAAVTCYVNYLEDCGLCPDNDPECCAGITLKFWQCWGGVFPGSDHGDPGDCACGT